MALSIINSATYQLLIGCFIIILIWIKSLQNYWKNKGLETPKPKFFFGNCWDTLSQKIAFSRFTINLYQHFKSQNIENGAMYFFWCPVYFPIGLEQIKNVLHTNFEHFSNRGVRFQVVDDTLNENIFVLDGLKWKNIRAKLTPTFTSGKMRMMFEILLKCTAQLDLVIEKFASANEPIEIKEILARFTTDIIGNCAFGIDSNCLKDPESKFRQCGLEFFKQSPVQHICGLILFIAPNLTPLLKPVALKRHVSDYYKNVVKSVVEYRETENIQRNDFMQLLIELKNSGKILDDTPFTLNDICAESLVFFIAGFETSSTTMTFCAYELAVNPEIQDRLRGEICQVIARNKNTLTYDCLGQMTYLDQVVNETLRKYPPLPALNRICTKNYRIPGTDIVIEKDTLVLVPVIGIHHDEEFYPNPDRFDPERFSKKNKNSRPSYAFLPFGEGPRICIGLRFGLMQTKLGLITLLRNYKLSLNSKTTEPLDLDPRSFIMSTKSGMWLNVTKI